MMTATQKKNKKLCERYPFLIPTNCWSGKRITEGKGFWPGSPDSIPEYNYEYTELDKMPEGWRIAFGEQMCEEIREELLKYNALDEYRIVDIKEKFGSLRWYDGGAPANSNIYNIIHKYMRLSERTCVKCGAPATLWTMDWYSPWCDKCVPFGSNGAASPAIPIEEYFNEVTYFDEEDNNFYNR